MNRLLTAALYVMVALWVLCMIVSFALALMAPFTFGARCTRSFPGNERQRQLCVYEMSKGQRRFPLDVKP